MSSLLTPTMAQNLAINECGSGFRRSSFVRPLRQPEFACHVLAGEACADA